MCGVMVVVGGEIRVRLALTACVTLISGGCRLLLELPNTGREF